MELDIPADFNNSIQVEKSNNSLSKIEKYITGKYDETVLKHLKKQIENKMRQAVSLNKCKISNP